MELRTSWSDVQLAGKHACTPRRVLAPPHEAALPVGLTPPFSSKSVAFASRSGAPPASRHRCLRRAPPRRARCGTREAPRRAAQVGQVAAAVPAAASRRVRVRSAGVPCSETPLRARASTRSGSARTSRAAPARDAVADIRPRCLVVALAASVLGAHQRAVAPPTRRKVRIASAANRRWWRSRWRCRSAGGIGGSSCGVAACSDGSAIVTVMLMWTPLLRTSMTKIENEPTRASSLVTSRIAAEFRATARHTRARRGALCSERSASPWRTQHIAGLHVARLHKKEFFSASFSLTYAIRRAPPRRLRVGPHRTPRRPPASSALDRLRVALAAAHPPHGRTRPCVTLRKAPSPRACRSRCAGAPSGRAAATLRTPATSERARRRGAALDAMEHTRAAPGRRRRRASLRRARRVSGLARRRLTPTAGLWHRRLDRRRARRARATSSTSSRVASPATIAFAAPPARFLARFTANGHSTRRSPDARVTSCRRVRHPETLLACAMASADVCGRNLSAARAL